jgi:hypothetical protein
MTKATHTHTQTHTHSEYVIPIAFIWQQYLRDRDSMLRLTDVVCPVVSDVMNWEY